MKTNANRIVSNTFFLYSKLVFSAILTLYATRVLLSELGIVDFGIYNLIAGVVIMLTFINGAMTITTQRYLSFYLGSGNTDSLSKIFNTSVSIHFLISAVIVGGLELIRVGLFGDFLNIPENRIDESIWCFRLMTISTFFTINSVPYDSLINANEDMLFDSIVGLLETFLKFLAALYLGLISDDKLIIYSVLIVLITILTRLIKTVWCRAKYKEAVLTFAFLKEGFLFKEMLSYASWNLFGSLCYVASSQGVAVVLNRFLGVAINGTYAISQQMNSQLQSFSVVIGKALNPQIVKSEGAGDREKMIKLALISSRSSAILLLFIVIPLIAEISMVLEIWLKNVPPQAGLFCVIILINALINQMSTGLKSAVQATGRIKLYQSVVGTTIILIVPIAYYLLGAGYSAIEVLLASTCVEIVSLFLRVMICNNKIGITYRLFLQDVFFRVLLVCVLPILAVLYLHHALPDSIWRVFLVFIANALVLCLSVFFVGVSSDERNYVVTALKKLKSRKIKVSV